VQAILLALDQLAKPMPQAEQQRFLERARNACLRLRRDLDQLLTVVKVERGTFDPRRDVVDLAPLLADIVDEFQGAAEARGLALRHVPTSLRIRTDGDLIEHLVRNLVSNAIEYTKRGSILVGCRRRSASIDIEVHDSGIGIMRDDLEKIFHEFHRVDPATGEGLGLGLSIAKQIADVLGHTLTVQSEPGEGTCFRIGVPRV